MQFGPDDPVVLQYAARVLGLNDAPDAEIESILNDHDYFRGIRGSPREKSDIVGEIPDFCKLTRMSRADVVSGRMGQ